MKPTFLLIAAVSLITSCVTPPSDSAAKVIAQTYDQPGGISVQFRSVDGTPVKHLQQIRLNPGTHRLVLSAHRDVATTPMSKLGLPGSNLGAGIDDFRALRTSEGLTLDAQPNATYRACVDTTDSSNPSFWIEDAATGAVVAGPVR